MTRAWLIVAGVNGFLAVAAGAFGAHFLKERLQLPVEKLNVFEIGARYHMYHALALLAVAWLSASGASTAAHAAGWCFLAGTVLFSGSLYALALTGSRPVAMITPVGGLLFLVGWALLIAAGARLRSGS
jgi:uncharacterized membrane protein YgdD (TMEM256/DUF423 family)